MNPYTSIWTGVRDGRRPAGVPPRPARRRPHRRARRRGRPPGAALHPLLGLPERLPGLLAHRRARLRVGLPRARSARSSRRSSQGLDQRADAAVGVVAVRRLLRGLPGQDRHPDRARAPARARRARGQVALERPSGWRWTRSRGVRLARRATSARSGSPGSATGRSPRRRPARRAGRRCASCRDVPRAAFREWWAERDGRRAAAGRSPRPTPRADRTGAAGMRRARRGPRPDPRRARRRRASCRRCRATTAWPGAARGGQPAGRRPLLRARGRVPRDRPPGRRAPTSRTRSPRRAREQGARRLAVPPGAP